VSAYEDDEVALLDQRIRALIPMTRAWGTMQDRDRSGPGAMVQFEASSAAQPVKVLGNVHAFPPDKVILERYGSEWWVVGTASRRALGHNQLSDRMDEVGTSSSGTWVDMPGSPTITVTKLYDATQLGVYMVASGYATVASVEMNSGMRISNPAVGYDTDNSVGRFLFNDLVKHLPCIGANWTVPGVPPAGTYTCTARMRRASGTGTINLDGSDWLSMWVVEEEPGG
jgi:hypothetical protein